MSTPYVPIWAGEQNPTAGLSETAAREYWKAHSVFGDAQFALRASHGKPADLANGWAELYLDTEHAKETANHRTRRDALRRATRLWLDDRPYELAIAPRPKAAKVKTCPHCGGVL